jgi:hypothetical protein
LAVTDAPLVVLRSVPGDHEYVVAPDAVSVVNAPAHIVAEFTVTTGSGFTVTVEVAVPLQPRLLPVIVYVVVVVGLAVTDAPLVTLRFVLGDQE